MCAELLVADVFVMLQPPLSPTPLSLSRARIRVLHLLIFATNQGVVCSKTTQHNNASITNVGKRQQQVYKYTKLFI